MEESTADGRNESSCKSPSSYREALLQDNNEKGKAASPDRPDKPKPNKNEPIKIFDSKKLSGVNDFDRMDYQKENRSSKL